MNQFLRAAASPETSAQLAEIGAALLLLGLVAFLANKMKFSVVPLYLMIGLALGNGGFIPLSLSEVVFSYRRSNWRDHAFVLLGLEYSAYDLAKSFKERKSAGVIDVIANATPGFLIGFLLGLGDSRCPGPCRHHLCFFLGNCSPAN